MRPRIRGEGTVTTPRAASTMALLGSGTVTEGIALTRDEFRAINKLYGFVPEKPNKKPPPPAPPIREDFDMSWKYERALEDHKRAMTAHAAWEDPRPVMQAGADYNAVRAAKADGLRLLAWLAKYVPTGEDPLISLIQLASDAGWDVDPEDVAYAEGEVPLDREDDDA